MISEGHAIVTGSSKTVASESPKKGRRSSDIQLSRLELDELSSTVSLYGNEIYKKYIDIAAELTNRAKAEREKEKELNFYRQMLDQSPAAMKIMRVPDKVVVYRNETHIKLEGQDLLGQVCGEECILDDSIFDQVVTTRTTSTEIIESRDGRILSVLSWPIFNTQNSLAFVASVARDITQRYHEAGVADNAAKRYEAVLARAARFVYIYDEKMRMVYTNATRPGGLLEHASETDLLTYQSTALYLQKIFVRKGWQKAVDVIQEVFEKKKEGSYQSRLLDGRLLSAEVVPIVEEEVFRGVAVLSQIVEDV